MTTTRPLDHNEAELHQPLVDLLREKGFRLRESDQLIYPDDQEAMRLRAGPPSQSTMYLQILDAQGSTVASSHYIESLRADRSPFIGARSVPGSARRRVLDDLYRVTSNAS